jgi:hypothetical protein
MASRDPASHYALARTVQRDGGGIVNAPAPLPHLSVTISRSPSASSLIRHADAGAAAKKRAVREEGFARGKRAAPAQSKYGYDWHNVLDQMAAETEGKARGKQELGVKERGKEKMAKGEAAGAALGQASAGSAENENEAGGLGGGQGHGVGESAGGALNQIQSKRRLDDGATTGRGDEGMGGGRSEGRKTRVRYEKDKVMATVGRVCACVACHIAGWVVAPVGGRCAVSPYVTRRSHKALSQGALTRHSWRAVGANDLLFSSEEIVRVCPVSGLSPSLLMSL